MAQRSRAGGFVRADESISLVDGILDEFRGPLGADFAGYRNHACRVAQFCLAQRQLSEDESRQCAIAAAFHDLGIWTANTFDYIPPSVELAKRYLATNGLREWEPSIVELIEEHHKLRRYEGGLLTETFRRADLIDFSLGLFKCGLAKDVVRDVRSRFPNSGFHKYLAGLAGRWIWRHPLDPVPVLKW